MAKKQKKLTKQQKAFEELWLIKLKSCLVDARLVYDEHETRLINDDIDTLGSAIDETLEIIDRIRV